MTQFWRNWFRLFCLSLFIFGAVLAAGAVEATSGPTRFLLSLLGGRDGSPFDPTLRFTLGVLGGVSIGWAVMLFYVINAAIALGAQGRPLWYGITAGLISWFVVDSTLSVLPGYGWNVAPNVLLAGMYLAGLAGSGAMRRA